MIGLSGHKKTCNKCGFTAPLEWFHEYSRLNRKTRVRTYYRKATCPGCLQEARDRHKQQKRVIKEAEQILREAK